MQVITTTTQTEDHSPIIRPIAVAAMLGVSVPTIWRWRRKGQFPEPIRLSAGTVGWRFSTLQAWIDSRAPRAPREAA